MVCVTEVDFSGSADVAETTQSPEHSGGGYGCSCDCPVSPLLRFTVAWIAMIEVIPNVEWCLVVDVVWPREEAARRGLHCWRAALHLRRGSRWHHTDSLLMEALMFTIILCVFIELKWKGQSCKRLQRFALDAAVCSHH